MNDLLHHQTRQITWVWMDGFNRPATGCYFISESCELQSDFSEDFTTSVGNNSLLNHISSGRIYLRSFRFLCTRVHARMLETKRSRCDSALAPFRYDFNPTHQMLLALCASSVLLLMSLEGRQTAVRLCNLREERLIAMGWALSPHRCISVLPLHLYQSKFSVALQMCVRDSILYLSTSLSYRTMERLANLAHHALPFLFRLNSPHVPKSHVFCSGSCFLLRLLDLGVCGTFPAEVSDARGDHFCLQCCFEQQESAGVIQLVTACLRERERPFETTTLTTLWSTSNAFSLHC